VKSFSNFDPNRELQRALANLETFSQRIENEPFTNLSHFEVKEGKIVALSGTALSKVINLAYHIVSPSGDAIKQEQKVLDEVLESSNVVRSYFPLIQMLEEGNSEQQKFVAHVKGAITRFNKVIDKVLAPPPTLVGRIVHYFYEQTRQLMGSRLKKIDIPQQGTLKINFPNDMTSSQSTIGEVFKINSKKIETKALASQKIAVLHDSIMPGSPISKQTLELYAMKVITLLGQHAHLPHGDARIIVEKTAKEMFIDRQEQLLTISQKLTPMPGQHIDISVSFRADPLTGKYTIPVQYKISPIEVTPSGFPHPLQHNGWALADFLIPTNLPSVEGFTHLEQLLKAKEHSAANLLPDGEYADRQRKALRTKRTLFKEHAAEFILLYHDLMMALVQAAPEHIQPPGFKDICHNFFTTASKAPYPYDFIADAHQLILECAICRPQKGLQTFWLEHALRQDLVIEPDMLKDIFQQEFKKGLEELAQQASKSESDKEHTLLEYCMALATVIYEPASQIALQHHLAILRASPPSLDLFAKKIQKALYIQLTEFQQELRKDFTPQEMKSRMKTLLENDLALFKAPTIDESPSEVSHVLKELNSYYDSL
jgi:hypothetical protein